MSRKVRAICVFENGVWKPINSVFKDGTWRQLDGLYRDGVWNEIIRYRVNPTSYTFERGYGSGILDIYSNDPYGYTINAPIWISVSPTSGYNDTHINLNINANTGAKRYGTIDVKNQYSETVISIPCSQNAVEQSPGGSTFSVTPTQFYFSTTDTGGTYYITSDYSSYSMTCSAPWVTLVTAGGSNNRTCTFTVQNNTAVYPNQTYLRSTVIYIKYNNTIEKLTK